MKPCVLIGLACLLLSCAVRTNLALPRARAAYAAIATTSTARFAPVPLRTAKAALAMAEEEEEREPGSSHAVELAQLAEGKVKIAALRARIEASIRLEELLDRTIALRDEQRTLHKDLEREHKQAANALRNLRDAEAAIEQAKRELELRGHGSSSDRSDPSGAK
jgi:hypothetical protein